MNVPSAQLCKGPKAEWLGGCICRTIVQETERVSPTPPPEPAGSRTISALSHRWETNFRSGAPDLRLPPRGHGRSRPVRSQSPERTRARVLSPPTSAHLLPGVRSPKSGSCSDWVPWPAILTAPTGALRLTLATSTTAPQPTRPKLSKQSSQVRLRAPRPKVGGAPRV